MIPLMTDVTNGFKKAHMVQRFFRKNGVKPPALEYEDIIRAARQLAEKGVDLLDISEECIELIELVSTGVEIEEGTPQAFEQMKQIWDEKSKWFDRLDQVLRLYLKPGEELY